MSVGLNSLVLILSYTDGGVKWPFRSSGLPLFFFRSNKYN